MIGTPYYFSPEMCKGETYDEKTDVWSLGVLLYEMCALEYPFKGKNIAQLTTQIQHSKYKEIPDIYSKNVRDIIHGMLKKEPERRPNIRQIMKHPAVDKALAKVVSEPSSADDMQADVYDPLHEDDENRDDDDGEGFEPGTMRDLEFDIDPLQKLPIDQFVQEI